MKPLMKLQKQLRKALCLFAVLIILTMASLAVFAVDGPANDTINTPTQTNEDSEQLTGFQEISIGKMLFQLIGSLLLIVLLIYGVVKFIAVRTNLQPSTPFRLIGGINLGQNKSVQMVEINKQLYLLGVGNEIRLLDKITDQGTIEEILVQANWLAENQRKQSWVPWLKRKTKKEEASTDFEVELNRVLQGWNKGSDEERKDRP
ncbi:flagellar biosynthetic protein FliO [Rubeoparvulum massiliense]|uniref:flagellar biosynthetic protein FliO n=1 Tax=Rubeoparvulum massiliense TaxID=1631346 RepID=UPI00065E6B73|nr:flagellar biosynthetic protein FliO [Rubeoparvulum massiliense]